MALSTYPVNPPVQPHYNPWQVEVRKFIAVESMPPRNLPINVSEARWHIRFTRMDNPNEQAIFRTNELVVPGAKVDMDHIENERIVELLKTRLAFNPLSEYIIYCQQSGGQIGRPIVIDEFTTISLICFEAYTRNEMPIQFYIFSAESDADSAEHSPTSGRGSSASGSDDSSVASMVPNIKPSEVHEGSNEADEPERYG
jgi:hypothetical protein